MLYINLIFLSVWVLKVFSSPLISGLTSRFPSPSPSTPSTATSTVCLALLTCFALQDVRRKTAPSRLRRRRMGCTTSIHKRYAAAAKKKKNKVPEVAIFIPALRLPVPIDLHQPLGGLVPRRLLDRLCSLRNRLALLAQENVLSEVSGVSELRRALEEYLPILLGLTNREFRIDALVGFMWKSLGDDGRETCFASTRYELASVIHMMAVLSLVEANLRLIPRESSDNSERQVLEDSKKVAIDLLLKASGCLDYCIHHVLVHLPMNIRKDLPNDLQDGVLEAVSIQALAQGVEMQLGLALECEKATLSVKRRLACEMVSYYAQAHYCLSGCDNSDANGKKLLSFIKYKYLESKASAYYYHGLVLSKGTAPNNHITALCCHLAANELLMDSKRACLSFCLATPVTRVPALWGAMKHLHKKIPEAATKKSQMYGDLLDQDKFFQFLPDLPEFALSLKPDEYNLPEIDAEWDDDNCQPQIQTLKEHLKDEDEDMETE